MAPFSGQDHQEKSGPEVGPAVGPGVPIQGEGTDQNGAIVQGPDHMEGQGVGDLALGLGRETDLEGVIGMTTKRKMKRNVDSLLSKTRKPVVSAYQKLVVLEKLYAILMKINTRDVLHLTSHIFHLLDLYRWMQNFLREINHRGYIQIQIFS